eukprot:Rmarinus@m.20744
MSVVLSCGGENSTVRLWDPSSGTTYAQYKGNVSGPHSIACVGDDFFAIAQAGKPMINLWTWTKDTCQLRCPVPEKVSALTSNRDGSILCGGGVNGLVMIWQPITGSLLRQWKGHYKEVTCATITDDNAWLITGGEDGLVHVWSLVQLLDGCLRDDDAPRAPAKGAASFSFSSHSLPISAIATRELSPGEHEVVTCSLDCTLRLWHVPSGTPRGTVSLPVSPLAVISDPVRGRVFVGCSDGTVRSVKIDLSAAQISTAAVSTAGVRVPLGRGEGCLSLENVRMVGHSKAVTCVLLALDSAQLITASADGTLRVWDPVTGQTVRAYEGHAATPPVLCAVLLSKKPRGIGASLLKKAAAANADSARQKVQPLRKFVNSELASGQPVLLRDTVSCVPRFTTHPNARCGVLGAELTLGVSPTQTSITEAYCHARPDLPPKCFLDDAEERRIRTGIQSQIQPCGEGVPAGAGSDTGITGVAGGLDVSVPTLVDENERLRSLVDRLYAHAVAQISQ